MLYLKGIFEDRQSIIFNYEKNVKLVKISKPHLCCNLRNNASKLIFSYSQWHYSVFRHKITSSEMDDRFQRFIDVKQQIEKNAIF